jgi:membrane dipeptidase
MDDEMLLALKTNGGVIQIVALSGFVKADPAERAPAIAALRREFGLVPASGTPSGTGGGRGAPPSSRPCPVENTGSTSGAAPAPGQTEAGLASLSADRRAQYVTRLAAIDKRWPAAGRATVRDFVDHIDYAVKLIGIDHVGISSDFDGGGGIEGWNSAAETFNVTLELVRRGYSEEQIAKIWSGNLLRVWNEVERVARQLQQKA